MPALTSLTVKWHGLWRGDLGGRGSWWLSVLKWSLHSQHAVFTFWDGGKALNPSPVSLPQALHGLLTLLFLTHTPHTPQELLSLPLSCLYCLLSSQPLSQAAHQESTLVSGTPGTWSRSPPRGGCSLWSLPPAISVPANVSGNWGRRNKAGDEIRGANQLLKDGHKETAVG